MDNYQFPCCWFDIVLLFLSKLPLGDKSRLEKLPPLESKDIRIQPRENTYNVAAADIQLSSLGLYFHHLFQLFLRWLWKYMYHSKITVLKLERIGRIFIEGSKVSTFVFSRNHNGVGFNIWFVCAGKYIT